MVEVEAEAVNSRKIVLTGEWRMGLKARRCDSQAGTEGWGGTSQAEVKKVLLLSVGQVSAAKDLSQREATAGLPDVRAGQGGNEEGDIPGLRRHQDLSAGLENVPRACHLAPSFILPQIRSRFEP